MPLKTVKKRKAWDKESMVRAVKAVRDKEMGLLKASKMFNVPRATLKDYVNSRGKEVEHLVTMRMGRKPVLPAHCQYCQHLLSEDKKGEKWVRCTKCCEWCHEECAGEREDWIHFICTDCLDS
jgi:hypothetical protein